MLARTCFIRYALFRQKGCTYVHHAFQLARGCIKNILFHNIYFSLYIQARSNFTKIYSKLHIYCRAQYRNFVSVAKKKLFLDFRLEVFFVFAWKTLKRRSIALLITIRLFLRASNLRGRFYRKFVTLNRIARRSLIFFARRRCRIWRCNVSSVLNSRGRLKARMKVLRQYEFCTSGVLLNSHLRIRLAIDEQLFQPTLATRRRRCRRRGCSCGRYITRALMNPARRRHTAIG